MTQRRPGANKGIAHKLVDPHGFLATTYLKANRHVTVSFLNMGGSDAPYEMWVSRAFSKSDPAKVGNLIFRRQPADLPLFFHDINDSVVQTKVQEIAGIALSFQRALQEGQWS
jgi:hypothetical protein